MKNPTDRLLLAMFLLCLPLCVLAWLFDIRLLLVLPALPFFCFQWLMCRVTERSWLRAIPPLCVALLCLVGAGFFFLGRSWDTVLGLILLWTSISPAVGCALGWAAHGLSRRWARSGKE